LEIFGFCFRWEPPGRLIGWRSRSRTKRRILIGI
jgi:hypothetical protein